MCQMDTTKRTVFFLSFNDRLPTQALIPYRPLAARRRWYRSLGRWLVGNAVLSWHLGGAV